MIRAQLLGAACVLALASGCAYIKQPPDTAIIPAWVNPPWQGDIVAILHAQWAWADPSRTHGIPAQGAQAVAEVDYLAGVLSTNPAYGDVSSFAKMRMLQARGDVRAILGIRPDARSQDVVDAMLATEGALLVGDRQLALHYLSAPTFTLPPDQTLALLGALPYVQTANIATEMTADSPIFS